MAQEERNQRGSTGCSGSGGGNVLGVNKSSKKQKQNKIPQRGLGVAQLEKIRIEGLKKKEAAAAAAMAAASAMLTSTSPISRGENFIHLSSSLFFFPNSDQGRYPPLI